MGGQPALVISVLIHFYCTSICNEEEICGNTERVAANIRPPAPEGGPLNSEGLKYTKYVEPNTSLVSKTKHLLYTLLYSTIVYLSCYFFT